MFSSFLKLLALLKLHFVDIKSRAKPNAFLIYPDQKENFSHIMVDNIMLFKLISLLDWAER